MRAAIALVSVLAGCGGCTDGFWDDVPTAVVTPIARPQLQDEWTRSVANQMEAWNAAAATFGCAPPFVLGEGGHRVRLIPLPLWRDPGTDGMTDEDEIRIVEHAGGVPSVLDGVTLHELGHALGLGHADPAFGPSVMLNVVPSRWAARDAAAAACAMHCGPCDPDGDRYSRP